MRRWIVPVLSLSFGVLVCSVCWAATSIDHGQALAGYLFAKMRGGYTLKKRVSVLAPAVEARLRPAFKAAGLPYPPKEVVYLAFKDARRIEVYARADSFSPWKHVKDYPVLGLSGGLGPKLKEGDNQVPEGIYRAEYLNPNGRFHVSIRLNYPNELDRRQANIDGRTRLGGDIMVHGTSSSTGCLAVGNQAAEDLFVLAGLVSKEHVRIVVSPTDFRTQGMPSNEGQPAWVTSLWDGIRRELAVYPKEPVSNVQVAQESYASKKAYVQNVDFKEPQKWNSTPSPYLHYSLQASSPGK